MVLVLAGCSCDEEILLPDLPGTCEPTYDCPAGTEYRNGECKASRCASDADCCPGQKCNVAAGFCGDQLVSCDADADCAEVPGQTCISFRGDQYCGYPNRTGSLSAAGTQPCVADTDCAEGRSCTGGRCVIFAPCNGGCAQGEICDIDTNTCFPYACSANCGEGQLAVVADPETMSGPQCCLVECTCATLPPVLPGQYGWNAEIAVDAQTVAVSAYDAVYGDLVVAFFDDEGNEISVQYVDGFPVDGPVEANPNARRGGRYAPGPDVGEHTSIAIDGQGVLHVAYYDREEGRLKYANYAGGQWTTSVVDETDHVGMYTSIAIGPDGNPRIAYMLVEGTVAPLPAKQSGLKYAAARTNMPSSPSDWSIQLVDTVDKPEPICGGGCTRGKACVDLGVGPECAFETMGCAMCATDEVCVMDAGGNPTCEAEINAVPLDSLPEGTGLFADLVFTSTGTPMIAYYDSIAGDLRLATGNGAGFALRTLDGDDAMNPTNVGQFASIAVSADGAQAGVAYFDATKDDLVYLDLGTGERQVVDDGLMPPDLNMVGADASLVFDAFGNPAIAYQDPTNIDLIYARRLGEPPMWSHQTMRGDPRGTAEGTAAGFYACQARRGDKAYVGSVDVTFDQESNLVLDLKVEVRNLD